MSKAESINISFKEEPLFNRYIYIPNESGDEPDISRIGAKAYHLGELKANGFPVPPYIVITTDAWSDSYQEQDSLSHNLPFSIQEQMKSGLQYLEKKSNKRFGDRKNPLCFSVRSGSKESMPGSMHTILNVGITESNIRALEKQIGGRNAQYAYFSLIRSLGVHAFNIPDNEFRVIRDNLVGYNISTRPHKTYYKELVQQAKQIFIDRGFVFPEDPWEQLSIATDSVFRSWEYPEAREARRALDISDELGTSVTIQEMVWGNSDKKGAGSGVLFTTDPTTGEDKTIGTFAEHGQGPKVVGDKAKQTDTSLSIIRHPFHLQLEAYVQQLKNIYPRPQEVEFVIDGKKLWFLQTRDTPMSMIGEFKFLKNQMEHGHVTPEEAAKIFSLEQLHRLLTPELDERALQQARDEKKCLGKGISLSPGWVSGSLVTSIETADKYGDKPVVLYADLSPRDIRQLPENVVGIISQTGSIGSHKARAATKLDARGVVAMFGVYLDDYKKGRIVTISGSTNEVFLGRISTSNIHGGQIDASEKALIRKWEQEHIENPWLFVSCKNGVTELTSALYRSLEQAREKYFSSKAHAIIAINAVIPSEIRIPYTVFSKTEESLVKQQINKAMATGSDVTVRTCRYPDTRGTSPYAVLTKEEDIRRFFDDSNYTKEHGGWPRWLKDQTITEVVVGEIPKNKLNPDYARYQCNWTLTCVGNKIYLQIVPGSPLLRSQEEKLPEEMITVEVQFDPSSTNGIHLNHLEIGESLKGDSERFTYLNLVAKTVLGKWWKEYNLPLRMAAISEVFSRDNFLTPGLEGQASRPSSDKISNTGWGPIVYGVKLDEGNGDV